MLAHTSATPHDLPLETDSGFQALLRRIQQGCQEAARCLVQAYEDRIRRVVRKTLRKPLRSLFDDDDFCQEVFLSFFSKWVYRNHFAGPRQLEAFLARVARSRVAEANRQRLGCRKYDLNRQRSLESPFIYEDRGLIAREPKAAEQLICDEEWRRVLASLPEHHQRINDAACQPAETIYDVVPYEIYPFAQCHPDRLATVATLLGLKPRPIDRCRVLELGCAGGGHLIPMAVNFPDSTFMGIDLSTRQLAEGQDLVARLGLNNIVLEQRSILEVGPEFGTFDYIICHGVYSWVPPNVQDKILDVCKRNLAPHGVAYVSYNTYPGWHMRGMIRDMMRYHARQFTEPLVRVKQARNLLDFLAKSVARESCPYSLLLKSELDSVRRARDSYLFHDHLEEVNEPVYFYEFARRVGAKGLRYLSEVDLGSMSPGNYPPEVQNVLQMLSPDAIHLEQYMDFLQNRMFRQTLLCHQDVVPVYGLRPERLRNLCVASPVKPVADKPDIHSAAFEEFRGPDDVNLKTCEPLAKAALVHLSEVWPQAVPFDTLRAAARNRLSAPPEDAGNGAEDAQTLACCLLTGYLAAFGGLLELHTHPPHFTSQVRERPVACPLARLQAETGNHVTNRRHESVALDEVNRQILRHLDGTNDRADLRDVLTELVVQGDLGMEENGQPIHDIDKVKRFVEETLHRQLPQLARNALLVD